MNDSRWGLVRAVSDAWAADPDGDVVWAGDHEGRRGVRMRQTVRDFTTVWFAIGDRLLTIEAYVLPAPPFNREAVFRQALLRSLSTRRMHFALDPDGDLVLVGRVPIGEVTEEELELILGEVYEAVEVAFKPLVRLAFSREKSV